MKGGDSIGKRRGNEKGFILDGLQHERLERPERCPLIRRGLSGGNPEGGLLSRKGWFLRKVE